MAQRHHFAFIAALLLSTMTRANIAPCLFGFANLSPADPHGVELVSLTYLKLFEQLGTKLTSETLTAIRKAENPFAIPEQKDTDLAALRTQTPDLAQKLEA